MPIFLYTNNSPRKYTDKSGNTTGSCVSCRKKPTVPLICGDIPGPGAATTGRLFGHRRM